ncbi:MAG: hypothetical protein HYY50_01590 [Candidatus Kerfeldbacteria bacterium]|nr:hypothetical protein [Candidatus Kerfeldbacteria bacterium]
MTGGKKYSRLAYRPSFTLVEILVVASVFSLLFLVASTIFVSVQSSQRASLIQQRVVADGRFMLETIARSVRLSSIDYEYYRDPDGNGNFSDEIPLSSRVGSAAVPLVLRDQNGGQTCYRLNTNVLEVGTDCAGWQGFTPADLQVTDFDAFVRPQSSPFLPVPTSEPECYNYDAGAGDSNFDPDLGVCVCSDADGDFLDSTNCFPNQRCVTATPGNWICQNATVQPQVTLVMRTVSSRAGPGESAETTLQTTVNSRVYGG